MKNQTTSIDRRSFLTASALTVLSASTAARAQQEKAVAATAAAAKPTQLLTDFIAGFELKQAPPLALEHARTAFIDTTGVTLAGSRSEPAAIVLEMVRAEGASPAVSIVGQSLRTSPQLAALANGVASHALDFDFTYMQGQLLAPVIPALLPLAESTGASPAETLAAFIVGFEVCSRLLARHRHHRHDRRGGGLREAAEGPGRRDPRRHRHQRLARLRGQRQLRHDDQAAAHRAGRAQRHHGGAAG
jgi:hypothetical protein